jgi:hypothetical protein
MFALCGNRTRDLLRIRRVFPPLREIGRHDRRNDDDDDDDEAYIGTSSEERLCFILCSDYTC